MLQIYFLTVMTNIIAGITIASSFLSKKIEGFEVFSKLMENRLYRVILGSLTLITGLFALLNHSTVSMAVFGNLIPAVSAMVMGIILVVNYFFDGEEEKKIIKTLKDLSEKYGNILGIAGIIIGLIHFIIPTALFL
jgi:purine-cytosine permease-like protein